MTGYLCTMSMTISQSFIMKHEVSCQLNFNEYKKKAAEKYIIEEGLALQKNKWLPFFYA